MERIRYFYDPTHPILKHMLETGFALKLPISLH